MARGSRVAWVRCGAAQVGMLAVGGVLRRWRRGLAASRAQVAPFAEAWRVLNEQLRGEEGPLWVVLGDSAAQGVGAASHEQGYVGQVRRRLEARDGRAWRVLNLSRSGARTVHVLDEQVPVLAALGDTPDLVTCAVGANDLLRTPMTAFQAQVRRLITALPAGTVLATLPQGLAERRAARVNTLIHAEAPAARLLVADVWSRTGAPWRGKYAGDFFHPNEVGYRDWADAFWDVVAEIRSPRPTA